MWPLDVVTIPSKNRFRSELTPRWDLFEGAGFRPVNRMMQSVLKLIVSRVTANFSPERCHSLLACSNFCVRTTATAKELSAKTRDRFLSEKEAPSCKGVARIPFRGAALFSHHCLGLSLPHADHDETRHGVLLGEREFPSLQNTPLLPRLIGEFSSRDFPT